MMTSFDAARSRAIAWWVKVLREHPDHQTAAIARVCLRTLGCDEEGKPLQREKGQHPPKAPPQPQAREPGEEG